ncbi:hypothetical protein MOQ_002887 [Trypanosoma cruzi marinkellei]|uniref:Uncharacterized protein n=1 Tax=Trypanosoma cruzi marinkellei TaxID=85056 RepID=K2N5G1_TRYCR|nr:hypothetical protein MOQ_002887 [Trypanosoma cruzi marinkellei]
MAALRSILSRREVNQFCLIGSELLSGPPCLSLEKWEAAIEGLEKGKNDSSILPAVASLSIDSASTSVRHYHNVYSKCVRLMVIPLRRWQQWREGLYFFMGESSREESAPLAKLCHQCLVSQQECFAVAFWGCWSSVVIRLELHMTSLAAAAASELEVEKNGENGDGDVAFEEGEEKDEEEEGVNTEDVDLSILRLRRRCYSELYQFQRLAHDAAHLFGSYTMVGRAERQWLTDTFLLGRDEKAAEALVRRSFKRDFGVPSADLDSGVLLDEYHSFEVNEGKEKAIAKRAQETLKGAWCLRARDVFEHEMRAQKERPSQESGSDDSGNNSFELLVRCLREKVGRPDLAFAVTMRRILEKEPFPATVDIARVEFALSLFQQWFEKYTHERHHGEIPLFTTADLWSFVLERHTELLKWVVFHYCHDEAVADLSSALEAVKAVGFSARHCLDVYLASMASRRLSSDVRKQFAEEARRKVCYWVEHTVVNTFLGAIQSLCSEAAAGVAATAATSPSFASSPEIISVQIDVAKAQLLLLCDAAFYAMDVRRILLPVVDAGLKKMNVISVDTDPSGLSCWTFCMLGALSCLRRSVCCLRDGRFTTDELFTTLHLHYRTLQRLSPNSTADLVTDAWIDFLSVEGRDAVVGARQGGIFDITRARHTVINNEGIVEGFGKEKRGKRPRDE